MDWNPADFHDSYRDDLLKLIEEKAKGKVRAAPKKVATRDADVIDFAALLEKSLSAKGRKTTKAANDEEAAPRRKGPIKARKKTAKAATHRKAA